jgi:GH24 family phage-related lysozyme (muramidase)
MFISENGLNLIKEFEGGILQSYDDYNESIIYPGNYVKGTYRMSLERRSYKLTTGG